MLRNKIIIIKCIFLLSVILLIILSVYNDFFKDNCTLIYFCVSIFFITFLIIMQKCPKCKKHIGDQYAMMNGEEKFFWLFPKKCPYCGEPFVKEKKSKQEASLLAETLMEKSLDQYSDD